MGPTTPPQAEAPIPPSYEIGRPTAEDVPRLLELWREQYDYHHQMDPEFYVPFTDELRGRVEADLDQMVTDEDSHILVAKEGSTLLGFITFGREQDDYYDAKITDFGVIKEILVTEDARSRGIGQGLIKAAEANFRQQGIPDSMIQCSSSNPRTLRVYEEAGYVPRQILLYKKLDTSSDPQ